ncbi:signal peptide peptidase SppA [Pseudodesulfovibrio sp. F-1]|uniref:Signal peptide peptidase SppA n=1 Tax=Pseudodesulfovibrio alkaliphilus TaxID=2661613 RepID=A0A7K1KKY0_9BACT|nr:signal peptide peptidase SppA [Pseudodesulfovibrio alkaliphilus]MUM76725.1 signal peptide peptidase SppA [Pseudodesulfovibrio alkaliphilus]
MRLEGTRLRFSQRHPFLFGVMMILLAVVLVMGATAFLRSVGLAPGGGFRSDKLGVVELEGMILDSAEVVGWIRTLGDDKAVKGVLLRVNSPGGAIAPSQEIYQAVADLAGLKPVVASYATVAASGGYYASAPAHVIVANPGSITASIGVMAEFITVAEALDKLGIKPEVLTTGRYKAAGTPMRDLTQDQRDQLLGLMRDLHEQFVDDVAAARKMERARVAAVADGRAVTGRQALELGLVDMLGSESQAFDRLKSMCGIEGRAVLVRGPVKERTLLERIVGSLKIDLSSQAVQGWTFSYK